MRNFLILALLALMLPSIASAQGSGANRYDTRKPDCDFSFTFSAVARAPVAGSPNTNPGYAGFDNRSSGCVTWSFVYTSNGFSAVSIELEEAPTSNGYPGSWVVCPNAGDSTYPLTVTTNSQGSCFGYFPWISVNLLSATGSGTIVGRAFGWRPDPGHDASATSSSQ